MNKTIAPIAGWPWTTPTELLCGSIMTKKVLIRKSGNVIELSDPINVRLSKDVRDLIEPRLTYTYQRYLRGHERYDQNTGYNMGPIKFEECRLYRYDAKGRLCCGAGFVAKLKSLLTSVGISVSMVVCDPPHHRPDRFKEDWDNVVNSFQFRTKQDECLATIAGNTYGIIKAPTGFGKGAVIAMGCCLYPNAMIHVVTPSKDLVQKTVKILTKFIPNVGQVGCGRRQTSRVTVFSADSLHLSDADADILFADEVHLLAAPSYKSELARYRYSRNFGFSASPTGRLDGADAELESFFGQVIFDISYQEAVSSNLVVPISVEWLNVKMTSNPCDGKKDVARKRWGIWRNEYRNKLIADKATSYADDDQVLILVESIEHLLFLKQLLPAFEVCYSENGLDEVDLAKYRRWGLMGEHEEPISAAKRQQLRLDFESGKVKKVIANKVWATGVDFEHLAVLIRADGIGSNIMDIQAPGRVSRISSGKEFGIVVDLLDQFDSSLHRKALGRRKSYARNGWSQSVVGSAGSKTSSSSTNKQKV